MDGYQVVCSVPPLPPPTPVIPRMPVVEMVKAQTAADHGITVARMMSESRCRVVSRARFDLMHRLREQRLPDGSRRFSLPNIGRIMGKDHTTIINGLRRWQELCASREAAE